MSPILKSLFATLLLLVCATANAQNFPDLEIAFAGPVQANTPFLITATSRGICRYPYPESQQPPDFVLRGNELEMTVYLRIFGNMVPFPSCLNRTQVYTAPALPAGNYKLALRARFYVQIDAGSFGPPFTQGDVFFEVGGGLGVTQVPATSGWSLALLFLGMLGAVRWVSGHSRR